MILKLKSLNNVIKLNMLKIMCIIRYAHTTAWNVSSNKCYIMLLNMRHAVFAQLIIFACLAFPAAQCGLGSFNCQKDLCTQAHNNSWQQD